MVTRLNRITLWIATILTSAIAAAMLAACLVALIMFAFLVHHLVFELSIASWVPLGVWSPLPCFHWWYLVDRQFAPRFHPRSLSRRNSAYSKRSRRTQMTLPWLIVAAVIGSIFYLFGA